MKFPNRCNFNYSSIRDSNKSFLDVEKKNATVIMTASFITMTLFFAQCIIIDRHFAYDFHF